MRILLFGLTITSSWGNGHATTYRSLCKALHRRGHQIDFVEKDVEWYRSNRDMPAPPFCSVHLYDDWSSEVANLLRRAEEADAIVIGSYFPDAIDLTRRLAERRHGPVLFYDIDTPITMASLRADGRTAYLDGSAIPQYSAYLSFTGGPTLAELKDTFGARAAYAFYCSVDPDLYRPTNPKAEYEADMSYLGTYAPDRQQSLDIFLAGAARLEPEMSFLVAGPQYPPTISWPSNVRQMIHIAPPQHPLFYSSARFTLNLTRAEMIAAGWSPSVRLFEASACGATILSDRWPGIEEFLEPNEEILLPGSAEETARLLREMGEVERTRIGMRARERILAEHTSVHRAAQFETIVSECS